MTLWLSLHFAIGLLGTWLARRYALNANLLDHPGERRSHDAATPRGGGIAIVASLLAAAIWLGFEFPDRRTWLFCFATGLAVVGGVGWMDDHRPLSAWVRLAAHGLAAVLLALGVHLTYGNPWLSAGSFVFAVGLTNAWNFMDGIDGLAASQAGLVAATIALGSSGSEQWLAAALTGACAGFLPLNFPRARVFLGDAGSGAIGFSIAALASSVVAEQQSSSRFLILLPLAAFLVDSGLTLASRMLGGEKWWRAHADHSFQIWARKLRAHWPVTLAYALWTAMGCMIWLAFRKDEFSFMTLSLLAWYMATGLFWLYLRRRRNDAPSGIRNDFQE